MNALTALPLIARLGAAVCLVGFLLLGAAPAFGAYDRRRNKAMTLGVFTVVGGMVVMIVGTS